MKTPTTSASGFRRGGAAALLLLAGVAAWAASSPDPVANRNTRFRAAITGYPDSPTRKVSGTNESFSVNVTATSVMYEEEDPHWDQAWVSYVKISIGGETVKEWTWASPQMQAGSKGYTARWDTTHFSHDTTKEVKVEAKCKVQVTGGPVTEFSATDATVSVSIYNYGFACEIPFGTANYPVAETVSSYFSPMNHFASLAENVTRTTLLAGLQCSTAFFFCGHGSPSPSAMLSLEPAWDVTAVGGNYNVYDQRVYAATTGLPPMNFALVDACETGLNSDMATAFLYPTGSTLDRSWLGFQVAWEWSWTPIYAPVVWEALSDGSAVHDANESAYAILLYTAIDLDPQNIIADPPLDVDDAVAIFGDGHTRLHGLYNGQDGAAPTTWYEVQ